MPIMTKEDFRKSIQLGKFTWEGAGIKKIQAALSAYHTSKTQSNVQGLHDAVEAWFTKGDRGGKEGSRSQRKLETMIVLRSQIGVELTKLAQPKIGIDFGDLKTRAQESSGRRLGEQKRNLQYRMEYADGSDYDFDYPIKFWIVKTDIAKQSRRATVVIPIKAYSGTTPHPLGDSYPVGMAGAPLTEDVKRRWNKAINDKWGKVAMGTMEGRREADVIIDFRFEFVDDASKACAKVVCTKANTPETLKTHASGTYDAVHWGAKENGSGGPEHEVGHLIGNPDEYYKITYEGVEVDWGEGWQPDMGVMNNPVGPALPRNYHYLGRVVAPLFGLDMDTLCLKMNVGVSGVGQQVYKLSEHIWG